MDFFSMPEPEWLTCECRQRTNRVPCWECTEAAKAKVLAEEADRAANASLPSRYAWASLSAPELGMRVRYQGDLKKLSTGILGATGAIFVGPSGSGKTSMAIACLRTKGAKGMFVSAFQLATARIQTAAGKGEADLVEQSIRVPLLLIDELGGEPNSANNAVPSVVFARYDAGRPTWVTTGLTSSEISAKYGAGFLRRVIEESFLVKLGGESR